MSDAAVGAGTQAIIVDEVFPHRAAAIWQALTSGELMARWMMPPSGFEPVEGCKFTFRTTPAGAWDGFIHCQVLQVRPPSLFVYSWQGGDAGNVGYGSSLDTVVAWTLSENVMGTRVRLVHSGFDLPRNQSALSSMGEGWKRVVPRLRATIAGQGV